MICRYNYSWDDNALIEFLIVLIATKVKDGFVVTGNYIYEICSESESPTKRKKIESRRSLKGNYLYVGFLVLLIT